MIQVFTGIIPDSKSLAVIPGISLFMSHFDHTRHICPTSMSAVIEVRYQIGWIWVNGIVMIINWRSSAMLAEAQSDIVTKTIKMVNFKALTLICLRYFYGAN